MPDSNAQRLKKVEQDAYERGQKAGEIGRHLRKHDECLEEIKQSQMTATDRLDTVEKSVTRILILAEAQVSGRKFWGGVATIVASIVVAFIAKT